jgi:hypothetical protein
MTSLTEIRKLFKENNIIESKQIFFNSLQSNISKEGLGATVNLASYIGYGDEDFFERFRDFLCEIDYSNQKILFHVNQYLVRNNSNLINFSHLQSDYKNLIKNYINYLEEKPLKMSLENAKQLEMSQRNINGKQVFEKIMDAKGKDQGFSVLRIGDGEGRFVTDLRFQDYSLEHYFNNIAKNIWFWNSSEFPEKILKDNLRGSYYNCDVLGFSPQLRIELEYHNNFTGYSGVVEGNIFCEEIMQSNKNLCISTNWINLELEWCGFYNYVKENFKNIIFVSPYKEIAANFKPRQDANVIAIQIPAENIPAMQSITIKRPHYPDVYNEILKSDVPMDCICLVAGGAMGKIYCDYFKSKGAIAIDIGSLVDKWMGIVTR